MVKAGGGQRESEGVVVPLIGVHAAGKFIQADRYVAWRLKRLMIKKRGRNLRAGQPEQWTREWFEGQGLYRLSGTVRYPKAP